MVWMATDIGCYLGISPVIMGIVFLAAGTSVPDAMGSMVSSSCQSSCNEAAAPYYYHPTYTICAALRLLHEMGRQTWQLQMLLDQMCLTFVSIF